MPDHAVILGAGIAGLTAAAVLAGHYDAVTIVERDRLPDIPIGRRGVQQDRHLHRLLSRGSQLLEQFLPGFLADLSAAGAPVLDDPDMTRVYSEIGPHTVNHRLPVAEPHALITYQASRPFLEFHLRQRVAALPGVTLRDGRSVCAFVSRTGDRVTGVSIVDWDSGLSESLDADLVVDATGRESWTPYLLETLGYLPPPTRILSPATDYHSQRITIPDPDRIRERTILVLPEREDQAAGLVACENDTWILTIARRTNNSAEQPTNLDEMLAAAADLMPAHVLAALHSAQALSDVSTYQYPGSIWRRFDRMARHPAGLVVIGDALCSLEPITGQGTTTAIVQAEVLRRAISRANPFDPQAFYKDFAKQIKPVWASTAMPTVGPGAARGAASLTHRAMHWGRSKVLEAAAGDVVVSERLMRVANFVEPPKRLLEPAFLARVGACHASQALGRFTR